MIFPGVMVVDMARAYHRHPDATRTTEDAHNMARPTKLLQPHPEPPEPGQTYGDVVITALKAGAFFDDACAFAGVAKSAAYKWLSRGRDAIAVAQEHDDDADHTHKEIADTERPYAEFADAVEAARGVAVVGAMGVIRNAMRGSKDRPADWKAAAWFLERTRPHQYGRRFVHVDAENPDRTMPLPDEQVIAALAGLDDGSSHAADIAGL